MFEFKGKSTDWTDFEFQDEDWVNWIVVGEGNQSRLFDVSRGWFARPKELPNIIKFHHFFLLSDLQSYYIEQLSQKICQMETKLYDMEETLQQSLHPGVGSY